MNRYYDISATKGFYALIDEIINSSEYMEAFGENTVPYERYITPRGFAMRRSTSVEGVNLTAKSSISSPSELDAFIPQLRNIPKQLFWSEFAHTHQQDSECTLINSNSAEPIVETTTELQEPMTESQTEDNYEYSQASDS